MSKIDIRWIILSVFSCVLFLSGCLNQKTSSEEMYQVLEKAVSAEKGFEEQQEPIVNLEKKEQDIYNQIMALGMKQHDEIVKLADEALVIVEKRQDHLKIETDSLKASEKEFKKVSDIKKKITDQAQRDLANELYDTMMQRYKLHNLLSKEYVKALKYDKELYLMLKDKNLAFESLENQVTKLNQTYKKIYESNEEFNQLTIQYNDIKLEYYKKTGLKLDK